MSDFPTVTEFRRLVKEADNCYFIFTVSDVEGWAQQTYLRMAKSHLLRMVAGMAKGSSVHVNVWPDGQRLFIWPLMAGKSQ